MLKLIISLIIITFCHIASAEEDIGTGLKIAPGWELVRTHCGACHSYKLVTAQRADKNGWLNMIRWMQETQNLWQFDIPTEHLEDYQNFCRGKYSKLSANLKDKIFKFHKCTTKAKPS